MHGIKGSIAAVVACLAAGCSSTIDSPMEPHEVADAVEADLGLICHRPEEQDATISCDEKADPGRSRAYADVRIQVIDNDAGEFEVSILSVRQSEIDRSSVEEFVGRFGFSADDLNNTINQGDRITRGAFTMDRHGSESIVIFD